MVSTKLKDYNVNSNDVTNIIFVYSSNEIVYPTKKFKPLMTHQIFDEENIYGYHGLRIDIYYAAHSAYCFIDIYYDDVLRSNKKFGLEPDNVRSLLEPWFPDILMSDWDAFKAYANKDEPDYVYGECIDCFMAKNEQEKITGFRIINCDLTAPAFKAFHKRFQTLIIMFIDAANYIDLDDPSWRILYLYEECRVAEKNKYCPVGFCSTYLFSGVTTVARISQFFIVPFLQKLGLGYRLLDATYNCLIATVKDLEDITVESPNNVFRRMRDNLDVFHLVNEPNFDRQNILNGYSDRMIRTARLKYKLSNEQARHIYEILRYYYSMNNPVEYKTFMLDLKRHRKNRFLMQTRRLRNRRYLPLANNDTLDLPDVQEITLQEEFDKFIHNVRPTMKYIANYFEKQANKWLSQPPNAVHSLWELDTWLANRGISCTLLLPVLLFGLSI